MAENGGNWERATIEKLAFAALKEQRRTRYWGIFFKLLTFAYLTVLIYLAMGFGAEKERLARGKHTALVEINGVIEAKGEANADDITSALQSAFKDKNTQGVILRINSPGGSPVQAGIINDEIQRLRKLHPNIPMYAVVEDVCASGGYYIAAAADKIYVDKASIVGSIGVRMDSFGFTGTMEKLGVERRVLTAGDNKDFMDPFLPLQEKDVVHGKSMLEEIHKQFIDVVKKGRGARLKDSPELFSGLFWVGSKSVDLGLADGFGSVDSVARDVVKAEEIVDFTRKENVAERLAKRLGAGAAKALAGAGGVGLR
ncbi:MAG: S49 family peptidase [Burkholderiales bacterium]|jgi:protease-4|nr:S49 family peptidase [Burkholderiales bacterium]